MMSLFAEAESGFGLHEQILVGSTAVVVVLILLVALLARTQLGTVPRGAAALFEIVYEWVEDLSKAFIGRKGPEFTPLATSLFLFILVCNWSAQIPWPIFQYTTPGHGAERISFFESPSVSYNTTLALALLSFFAFNFFGIIHRVFPDHSHAADVERQEAAEIHDAAQPAPVGGLVGIWQWIGHFWQPTPMLWRSMEGVLKYALVPVLFVLFLGLNFIEEVARILSLSLRLFGNISGEHEAKIRLFDAFNDFVNQGGWGYPLAGVMEGSLLFVLILGTLAGFVQAMVFMMLTLSYIGHAVADEH
jgi:F-type H+-transporting ATPase subunit a